MSDAAILSELERRERQWRRDMRAAMIRRHRYLTRTPLDQQQADERAHHQAVLARGWITKSGSDHQDGGGI